MEYFLLKMESEINIQWSIYEQPRPRIYSDWAIVVHFNINRNSKMWLSFGLYLPYNSSSHLLGTLILILYIVKLYKLFINTMAYILAEHYSWQMYDYNLALAPSEQYLVLLNILELVGWFDKSDGNILKIN